MYVEGNVKGNDVLDGKCEENGRNRVKTSKVTSGENYLCLVEGRWLKIVCVFEVCILNTHAMTWNG